jgi:hypothetical protein
MYGCAGGLGWDRQYLCASSATPTLSGTPASGGGSEPSGVFILEVYTPAPLTYGTGGPSSAELLMTLDDLRVDLAGLTFEIAHEIERDVVEGRYHTGRAAVIQVLARKS